MRPEPDEVELARRARGGDREALTELIERLRLSLFAQAYAELRHYEDAQDAVAAALFQICRRIGDLRAPEAMRVWMHTIVRNETHRMRRGKQAQYAYLALDETCIPGTENPSPLLRLDIERALRQLPTDQSRAIRLFYLSEWPIAEIALHMARPEGTIKRWLHQGRQRLATEMKGYFPMEHVWKAGIVAPELTPDQLQRVGDALTAAGWTEIQTVHNIQSLEELYHIEKTTGNTVASWTDTKGEQQHLTAQRTARLSNALTGSRFLILGERIADQSVFEFLPILRALSEPQNMFVCLLSASGSCHDSTVYAASLSGVQLMLTTDTLPADFQRYFSNLREELQKMETPA